VWRIVKTARPHNNIEVRSIVLSALVFCSDLCICSENSELDQPQNRTDDDDASIQTSTVIAEASGSGSTEQEPCVSSQPTHDSVSSIVSSEERPQSENESTSSTSSKSADTAIGLGEKHTGPQQPRLPR